MSKIKLPTRVNAVMAISLAGSDGMKFTAFYNKSGHIEAAFFTPITKAEAQSDLEAEVKRQTERKKLAKKPGGAA